MKKGQKRRIWTKEQKWINVNKVDKKNQSKLSSA